MAFNPDIAEILWRQEQAIKRCVNRIVNDYNRGINVEEYDYLNSIGFFKFSLCEQHDIIDAANERI